MVYWGITSLIHRHGKGSCSAEANLSTISMSTNSESYFHVAYRSLSGCSPILTCSSLLIRGSFTNTLVCSFTRERHTCSGTTYFLCIHLTVPPSIPFLQMLALQHPPTGMHPVPERLWAGWNESSWLISPRQADSRERKADTKGSLAG